MKQHIDSSQLNELSEKGLRKLAEYEWEKNICILNPIKNMPNGDGTFSEEVEPARLHLLSIGHMIEILGENLSITKYVNGKYLDAWSVGYLKSPIMSVTNRIESKELCDALWSSVKEVLEKEGV